MTTGLTIKQVAEASGFTAATLRYYEQIGLLPEADRTPAGYRTYDQRMLERLAFIARAKHLGCNLEEIAGLTKAWDGGECGPVQDQLRQLVAAKVTAAQDQIAELATFAAELQGAAADLERHRPEGACDASCGCISEPDIDATTAMLRAVTLSATPTPDGDPAIACTLAAGAMKGRVTDWQSLLARIDRRERIDGGVRVVFARSASIDVDALMRLVAAEQDCCQFFRFAITVDMRGIALEVRAPDEAREIVESMFGAPS